MKNLAALLIVFLSGCAGPEWIADEGLPPEQGSGIHTRYVTSEFVDALPVRLRQCRQGMTEDEVYAMLGHERLHRLGQGTGNVSPDKTQFTMRYELVELNHDETMYRKRFELLIRWQIPEQGNRENLTFHSGELVKAQN